MRVMRAKFRGKRKSDGKLVYGYYWQNESGNHFIRTLWDEDGVTLGIFDHEIDSETVCQCTGIKDDNGKEIYEGDIIKITIRSWDRTGRNLHTGYYLVEYKNGKFGVVFRDKHLTTLDSFYNTTIEKVGNVFENPEMLNEAMTE